VNVSKPERNGTRPIISRALAVLALLVTATLSATHPVSAGGNEVLAPSLVFEEGEALRPLPQPPPVLTPSLLAEIHSVTSESQLDSVSLDARRAIVTPAFAYTSLIRTSKTMSSGCDRWSVTRKIKNVLGWTLIEATQKLYNVCRSGDEITSSPTQTRYANGSWGWAVCGWFATHDGWITQDRVYGAGGWAKFALGNSCFAPQYQLGVEIQADAPSKKWWGYTSG